MACGTLPALNRNGNWAAYFGGSELLALLDSPDFFWRWHLVNSAVSAVLQITLLLIKTLKARNLTSQQAHMYVLVGNLLNVNGILTSIAMTSCFLFFYVLINNQYFELSYDDTLPPPSILVMTICLLVIQWRPFFNNHALR